MSYKRRSSTRPILEGRVRGSQAMLRAEGRGINRRWLNKRRRGVVKASPYKVIRVFPYISLINGQPLSPDWPPKNV